MAAASAAAYAATGDYKNATIMAASIALSAVGAGAAVKAYQAVKKGDMILVAGSSGGAGAGKAFGAVVKRAVDAKNRMCSFGCGRAASEVDHVVPRSRSGNNTIKNAQPLCRTCNASKGNNNFPKGYSLTKKTTWYARRIFRR